MDRWFAPLAGGLLTGIALAAACGHPEETPRTVAPDVPERPNVVVLVMDTTRADRCSVHGYERPTTPELEKLAREAVVYDAAWAPSSWTLPVHASILTGHLPRRHGATTDGAGTLQRDRTTLAEILRDAGYATGAFSNNPFVAAEFGLDQGFGTFVPLHSERGLPEPVAAYAHDRALEWTRKQRAAEKPFFLLINDMEPHSPYTPAEDMQQRFARDATDADIAWGRGFTFPENLRSILRGPALTPPRLRVLSDLYDAEIATLDREIGRFVDALRADGTLDETLFIVTGDHGDHFGENGLLGHWLSIGSPLLRVPMVVRYPRGERGGARVTDVVRSEDLFPTILESCGLPVPEDTDGRSLLGDLGGRVALAHLGRPKRILNTAAMVAPGAETKSYDVTLQSAFDGRHHLIRTVQSDQVRLFDVHSDPRGEIDVAPHHPDIVERLRSRLP